MDYYDKPLWRILITLLATAIAVICAPLYVPIFGLALGFTLKYALPDAWSTYAGLTSGQLPLVFASITVAFYAFYVGFTIYKTKNFENSDFDEYKG